jgi:hypothetical protein
MDSASAEDDYDPSAHYADAVSTYMINQANGTVARCPIPIGDTHLSTIAAGNVACIVKEITLELL